jgi:micrococcal nuclease
VPSARFAVAACVLAAAGCRAAGVSPVRASDGGVPRDAVAATVVRVVDGDTVVLRIGGRRLRVRLIGVDAPETWLRHDCFGAEATRELRRLIPPGSRVRAAGDAEPYDRYGRRLLYLWTARGVFVPAALIRTGFARALPIPPDTSHATTFREAEDTARRARLGLWRACA